MTQSGHCARLLGDHTRRSGRLCGRRSRRNRERQPSIPAIGSVLRVKFLIGFQVEIALHIPDREQIRDLRSNAKDLRLEAADPITRAAVTANLFVNVADYAEGELLR